MASAFYVTKILLLVQVEINKESLLIDSPLMPPPTIFYYMKIRILKKNLMCQILTKSKKFRNLGPWTYPRGVLLKLVLKSYYYKLTDS